MANSDAALQALVLLALLILTSLLDVIATNFFVQAKEPRSHNRLKLINECLARHQLAYPVWYMTVMLLVSFPNPATHESIIVRSWMQLAAIASVLFWLGGLNAVAWQDDAVRRHHKCPNAECETRAWRLAVSLLAMNSVLAVVSAANALFFIHYPPLGTMLPKN
jgi:hypothetical protein